MTPESIKKVHDEPRNLNNRINLAVSDLHEISHTYVQLNRKLEKIQRSLILIEYMVRKQDHKTRIIGKDIEEITERFNQIRL